MKTAFELVIQHEKVKEAYWDNLRKEAEETYKKAAMDTFAFCNTTVAEELERAANNPIVSPIYASFYVKIITDVNDKKLFSIITPDGYTYANGHISKSPQGLYNLDTLIDYMEQFGFMVDVSKNYSTYRNWGTGWHKCYEMRIISSR